jgi:hypothetical protein
MKENTGSLRPNPKKTSDKHPSAKGSANIAGIEYWMSAWTNTDQLSGDKYWSIKFEQKEAQR